MQHPPQNPQRFAPPAARPAMAPPSLPRKLLAEDVAAGIVGVAKSSHPKDASVNYVYGTAGFRMKASLLDPVMYRMGLLAVLRSQKLGGKVIGAMVTASHNPAEDNGAKLVEPLGEMLLQAWEGYATRIANVPEADLPEMIADLIDAEDIDTSIEANVVIARDTRASGPALVQSFADGVQAMGFAVSDYGIFTTPELHYVVRCLNTWNTLDAYGFPSEEAYILKLAKAYRRVVGERVPSKGQLVIDCANGVGTVAMGKMLKALGSSVSARLENVDVDNYESLNHNCGADFVKLYQTKPKGMETEPGHRYASLDGDADRVVFYYVTEDGSFRLLDGDKIATLLAAFIIDLVRDAGLSDKIAVGLVQTAYANGSSTRYAREALGVPVAMVPTGVKHLHHEAQHYDVGVYFEANGHGTILFSDNATAMLREPRSNPTEASAAASLLALADLINQAVGDAVSDLLAVEAVLVCRGWTLPDWDSVYDDVPNRQEKVKVKDRYAFKTTNAEQTLTAPDGLQARIDAEVSKYSKGRCFVRPSGTEDIVRVYAEADTRENTDKLAWTVGAVVFDQYGGTGERPKHFPQL
ncbi:hypothetical protein DFJ74DRAFT_656965 [Hyaloraphidium curvatum]|nr:hypothetical protein DFJ74DRAFT_656965 [Hyaloraphidium curvatum]